MLTAVPNLFCSHRLPYGERPSFLSVPVTEDNVTHTTAHCPGLKCLALRQTQGAGAQLRLACGDVRWLRLITACLLAHVLAIPTLHADWGFIFPTSQLSTVLMAQMAARKACNLDHTHLDISLQNESVLEAYAREWDDPFGCALAGGLCCA